MVFDFATCKKFDRCIRLLKGSNRKRFTRSLGDLVASGYAISSLSITMKVVPRIGKVVSYFAELKLPVARKDKE
jgi:hypothetical protein